MASLLISILVLLSGATGFALTFTSGHPADAQIVLPEHPRPVEQEAAKELQLHLQKAFGTPVPIVNEPVPADWSDGKIYIGATRALGRAGLSTAELGEFGFAGRLEDGNLFFYGVDGDEEPLNAEKGLRKGVPKGSLYAVYDFLESELGVRWIWPGETGLVIPDRETVTIRNYDRKGKPRFLNTEFRVARWLRGKEGWSSDEARTRFLKEQDRWLLRHRFQKLKPHQSAHAFSTFWRTYRKTHPDIFALLPNGKREPLSDDPTGKVIAMCVSNPEFHALIVKRWKARVTAGPVWHDPLVIDATENDVSGRCVCAECRAWDAPDERFKTSAYWGQGVVDDRTRFIPDGPSLSDRYARFYLAVLEEAQRTWRPDVSVIGNAYANYGEAPEEVKLNDRIIINFVRWPAAFPWSEASSALAREEWTRWAATGARLVLRPNTTRAGHTFPIFFARKLGDAFTFCAEHGMIGTDFDALTGQWATQGPSLYMLGRKHVRPEESTQVILEEFYAAFGPAAEAVRNYFGHWEALSEKVSDEAFRQYRMEEQDGALNAKGWLLVADRAFTPEAMQRGRELLNRAKEAVINDPEAAARVAVLDLGLEHAHLTLVASNAYKVYQQQPNPERRAAFSEALKALLKFRTTHEGAMLTNLRALDWEEARFWGSQPDLRKVGLLP